jgi:hypothetical protein
MKLLPLLLPLLPLLLLPPIALLLPLLLPCQPRSNRPLAQHTTTMIKKFALLATMAALFVACGSSNTEAMEQQATEAAAEAESAAAAAAAEAEAAAAAAAAAVESAVDSTAAAAEGALEEVKEAVK